MFDTSPCHVRRRSRTKGTGLSDLETSLARYLAHRMPSASDLRVTGLSRIHGGSSQETYRYEASWSQAGETQGGWFILRRAPEAGLVNAEHDLEYSVYSALAGSGVPRHACFARYCQARR